jgi:prephenate dehydratase
LKTVRSHVHALSQCRKLIRKLGLKPVVAADTAGAAAELAQSGDKSVAVIASELAGKIYRLKTLKRNIEDADHNTTRFLIMARKPSTPPDDGKLTVTTFVFNVKNVPAALYKALGGFATNGVNMTKLESYMVGGEFTATQFYADVEAHPKSRALDLALKELEFVTRKLKILGVYRGHSFRAKAAKKLRKD